MTVNDAVDYDAVVDATDGTVCNDMNHAVDDTVDDVVCLQEVEKKLEELKNMCTETRKEIGQRHMEAKNLKEDLEQKNRGISVESKQLEELVEQVESLKVGRPS